MLNIYICIDLLFKKCLILFQHLPDFTDIVLRLLHGHAGKAAVGQQLIQLLPSSYNQRRTVMLNYEVLHNIYLSRKNHRLDEWHVFCDWIEELPYSELIIGET